MLSRTWQTLSNTTDTTKRLLNARRTQHNLTESPKSHQHTCTPETEWSFPCFHCFPARQALARLKLIGLAFDQPQSVQVTRERTVAIAFHETSGSHFMTCHSHVAKSWPMWTQCTQYRTQLSQNCRYNTTDSAGLRTCIHNFDQLGLFATCDLRFCQQNSGAIAFPGTFAPHLRTSHSRVAKRWPI